MKKNSIGTKKHLMKTMGVALTLIFTVGLYASGVFADTGCGVECCHQISQGGMRHTPPIKSVGNCRSEDPRIPCDLQSKPAVDWPEYPWVSFAGRFPNPLGPMGISFDSVIDDLGVKPNCSVQTVWKKFQPPSLYLQKLSLLI